MRFFYYNLLHVNGLPTYVKEFPFFNQINTIFNENI